MSRHGSSDAEGAYPLLPASPPPPPPSSLTAEQKRRIDHNFRAAKAILSRKRPLPSSDSINGLFLRQRAIEPTPPFPAASKSTGTDKQNASQYVHHSEDHIMPVCPHPRTYDFIPAETSNKNSTLFKDHTMQRPPLAVMSVNQPLHQCTSAPIQKDASRSNDSANKSACGIARILRKQCDSQNSEKRRVVLHRESASPINENLAAHVQLDENTRKQLDAFSESSVSIAQRSSLGHHSRSTRSSYSEGDLSESCASSRNEHKNDISSMAIGKQVSNNSYLRSLASLPSVSLMVQEHSSTEDMSVHVELDKDIMKQVNAFSESRISIPERNSLNCRSRTTRSSYYEGAQSNFCTYSKVVNKNDANSMTRRGQVSDHSVTGSLASPTNVSPVTEHTRIEDIFAHAELDENILKELDAFSEARVSMAEQNSLISHSRSIRSSDCEGAQSDSRYSMDACENDICSMARKEQVSDNSILRSVASPPGISPVIQKHNCAENMLAHVELNKNILKQLDAFSQSRVSMAEMNSLYEHSSSTMPPYCEGAQLDSNTFSRDEHTNFSSSIAKKEQVSNHSVERSLASTSSISPMVQVHSSTNCRNKMSTPVIANGSMHKANIPAVRTVALHTNSSINSQYTREPLDEFISSVAMQASENDALPEGTLEQDHDKRSPYSISNIEVQGSGPVFNTYPPPASPSIASQISISCLDVELPYIRSLNESQREAVLSDIQKPLLILAGPGSGKTSTMVARLLRLLHEGVNAANILAMTFTTAAASEMKDRVGNHVGKLTSKELNVCTFHSFCLQLCRLHATKLGRSPEFLVYGHGQQKRAVAEAVRLAIQSSKGFTLQNSAVKTEGVLGDDSQLFKDEFVNLTLLKEKAKTWDKFVTQAKASGRTPEFYESRGNVFGAAVLRHYNATLTSCNALDYHDFISCAVSLLQNDTEVLNQCLMTWTCVLVDEFQDTSSMQYELLRLLASHKRVTVVGDDDQSIFSFNGADSSNFDAFRKDFSELKEVRLQHNYRSTRCIVEAATSLIGNNIKRCVNKQALTDNDFGEKITIKECRNVDAQCCFIIDTIMLKAYTNSTDKPIYENCAILYRRQVTGKLFQSALRSRKIPFNIHGVAFYRKKIVKAIIGMLWTALDCQTEYCARVYKVLYAGEKAEAKKVVEYVEKVSKASKCTFLEAARKIFTAKISGTFSRRQLACGKRVLTVINSVHALARKESSLSTFITAVMNFLPQRSALQKRAVLDTNDGKFLNEDDDPRTVLEYILDDVSEFLCNHFSTSEACESKFGALQEGCLYQLKSFLDHLALRELGNFKSRREENKNSVTLTTMHQSKGLEWDTVFIVKANDSEIPLLHETMGNAGEGSVSLEEERRLFYVAMTRAKKKLYILYITWDQHHQLLRPTRFLRELPQQYLDYQVHGAVENSTSMGQINFQENTNFCGLQHKSNGVSTIRNEEKNQSLQDSSVFKMEAFEPQSSSEFLKGFNVEARSTIASIFHSWAKKPAFQDPKRLLDKVCFVLEERLRSKTNKNKDTLRALKCSLDSKDALLYAEHVLNWIRIPPEERALLMSEKQEFFQQKCAERAMGSAPASTKQVSYLRMLGCTIDPTSRLHASRLIEQYKKL